jgi:ABC-2 type transport system ATP-binding protein
VKVIECQNLVKKFKNLIAVNDVTFDVEEGEIFALLGPNGAGKTTIISILCTLLRPTKGSARVYGFDVLSQPNKVRNYIGIVFQSIVLDELLTGSENLRFYARLGNMPKSIRKNTIEEMLDLVDLLDRKDDLVKHYSGGMKRRLEIARGLLFHPKILFLDEATLGLDAQNRRRIWDYVKRLNEEEQITVFMTTHYIDEAEICKKVAIIDHGVVVALDTPEQLKAKVGSEYLQLTLSEGNLKKEDVQTQFKFVTDIVRVEPTSTNSNQSFKFLLSIPAEEAIPEIISWGTTHNLKFKSVSIHKPTLEDVFIEHTGRGLRDEEDGEDLWKLRLRDDQVRGRTRFRRAKPRRRR